MESKNFIKVSLRFRYVLCLISKKMSRTLKTPMSEGGMFLKVLYLIWSVICLTVVAEVSKF